MAGNGLHCRATAVRERGPLPVAEVHTLGAALAEGLIAIRAASLVHRDLEPGTIILAADYPPIIDLGSRALDATSAITTTGSLIATYAATGHDPLDAPYPAVVNHVLAEPPNLEGLSGPLRDLIVACLETQTADRGSRAILTGLTSP